MSKRKIRFIITLLAVILCMTAFSITAYADGGGTDFLQPQPVPPSAPLTPEGNLTLVDDIDGEQREDKQFITVVTKNGNYFYIIIDRAAREDNVYFLNMVDEADLLALLEDAEIPPQTPVIPTPEPEPEPLPEPEPAPEPKNSGGLLLLLVILLIGGGAAYYFKLHKPRPAVKGSTDLDEYDFDEDEDEDTEFVDEPPYAEDGESEAEADEQ